MSFGVDATSQPYENENAAWFALTTLCWPILYFIAWKCTTDTNYMKEETVVTPVHMRKELAATDVNDLSPVPASELESKQDCEKV